MEKPYIINVDWFQVACHRDPTQPLSQGMMVEGILETDNGRHCIYELRQPREFSALFNNSLEVCLHKFPIATVHCEPRPTSLARGLCMVKLANPILYGGRWMWYLYDVLHALGWKFHNISRVDLAIDFNKFCDDLEPATFINRYISDTATSTDVRYWHVGTNRFAIIGDKEHDKDGVHTKCEYLRFGQRSSGVATYLYNKTKELNDKGGKQYIRDIWQKGGLTDTEAEPVFRIEFSINSQAVYVKRKMTPDEETASKEAGEMFRKSLGQMQIRNLALDDFSCQQQVEQIFWGYFCHYFRFKIVGTQKKPQHWEEVKLFDIDLMPSVKPYRVSAATESGVSERNAAKRIARLLESETTLPLEDKLSLVRSTEILTRIADHKSTCPNPDAVRIALKRLEQGYDWTSLKNSRLIAANQRVRLKTLVSKLVTEELQDVITFPAVNKALTEYDAAQVLGQEQMEQYIHSPLYGAESNGMPDPEEEARKCVERMTSKVLSSGKQFTDCPF